MTVNSLLDLKKEVAQEKDYIISLRRYFHQHPEPSLKEFQTSQRIKAELDKIGLPYVSVGETGVLATLDGGKGAGKTIVLRGDIDALELEDATGKPYASKTPGLNHACGHDGHTAALLGAAKVLKKLQPEITGTIKFAFQQAEEIGAGACQFVDGGFLDQIDQVFGIHLDSSIPSGSLVATPCATNASCDIFYIEITGLSSHVGQPEAGRDALLSASSIVVELQKIVAREINPLDPVVVGIGLLKAGTRYNIVANHAQIEGTVRAFSHETRQFALKRVEEISREIAQAHRTECSFRIHDAAGPLINDPEATKLAQEVAGNIVGKENVITNQEKRMGADDFADFLQQAQGVYGRVGTRLPDNPETHYPHHHEKFDIDENALPLATEYHVLYALTYLSKN